ncbi:MAG: hypothetical protein KGQ59_09560 [Bdellovibrionales bacterium]|nr:hypothetical protein [Bdellovibrionales bacterium]
MRAYFALIGVLGAWLGLYQVSSPSFQAGLWSRNGAQAALSSRQELRHRALEVLDDLVQRERLYHRRTGTFTPLLGSLEFEVPEDLRGRLQVQVIEAARDRLLVRASTELESLPGEVEAQSDLVWMNQAYQVQANFPVPSRPILMMASQSEEPLPELVIERMEDTVSLGNQKSLSHR